MWLPCLPLPSVVALHCTCGAHSYLSRLYFDPHPMKYMSIESNVCYEYQFAEFQTYNHVILMILSTKTNIIINGTKMLLAF